MRSIYFGRKQHGATLVEVLVAIALAAVLMPTLATALVTSHSGRATARQQLKAEMLVYEASEALRAVRDHGWDNLATDGVYHPQIDNANWTLANGPETIGAFTRHITLSTAQRDSSGVLVENNGTNDPATKRAEITVTWEEPYSASASKVLYLTRWHDNAVWEQSTEADFLAGTTEDTVVTSTGGGAVELAGAPNYATEGTFESNSFDAGTIAAFNYLTFTADQPARTTLQFQIATNDGDTTWNYIGPDGTDSTYFTASEAIPLEFAEARYIRYKAYFTGDGTTTPVLHDITINYSL